MELPAARMTGGGWMATWRPPRVRVIPAERMRVRVPGRSWPREMSCALKF